MSPKMFSLNDIDEIIEKMSEQNPANKVEPKFHVGDYVVDNCGYVWKIEGTINQFYILEGIEGGESRPTIEWVNKTFHLWTIQDAKDGDVVVDKSDGTIGIFQSIGHHPDGGSYNDPSYCFLHCRYDDEFFYADFEHGNTIDSDDLVPATKEQRDTLMKAMADAGYTFDFEKKELKKIGQKPAWSEEDETALDDALWCCKQAASIAKNENDMGNVWYAETWLESLKDRVQPQAKQEWSEEDERMIEAIIKHLERQKNYQTNTTNIEQCQNWLKTLKDRYAFS